MMFYRIALFVVASQFSFIAFAQEANEDFQFPVLDNSSLPKTSIMSENPFAETRLPSDPTVESLPIPLGPSSNEDLDVSSQADPDAVAEEGTESVPQEDLGVDASANLPSPSDKDLVPQKQGQPEAAPAPTPSTIINPLAQASDRNSSAYSSARFTGYMPLSPSRPSALLAHMQCSQTTCGDVWAGFAYQHERDLAAYCSMRGSHCNCGPCHRARYADPCVDCAIPAQRPVRNRYVTPGCSSCGTH